MRAREGDFIETYEDLIFDVKGLIHPPHRIIAFARYFPNEKGERKRNGKTYSKVYSLSKRYELLKERYPKYLVHDPFFDEMLSEVPVDAVRSHYKPVEKLRQLRGSNNLDTLESQALQLAHLLRKAADIRWDAISISGSVMVELQSPGSDIDLVIYGSENCQRVYSTLKRLLKEGQKPFKPYNQRDLKALFDFRSKDTLMSYGDFVRSESRKVLQGKFLERSYFIRFVKNWSEVTEDYGDVRYVNVGYTTIEATVIDDSQSTYTPCVYRISDVHVIEGPQKTPIEEIASFRGRFCEQAMTGEAVIAQGKIERVTDSTQDRQYFRLLLGNRPSDYMRLA